MYEYNVNVISRTVSDWFRRRERRGCIYAEFEKNWLEKINEFYDDIHEYATRDFSLPPENLIILGLKHLGLLNIPGVIVYYVKTWDQYSCEITIMMDEHSESDECGIIEDRIQRFFSSIAYVDLPKNIPNW